MSLIEVKVPDIGDFKDVPIIEVHVKPGDSVRRDDPLVTLESDKAAMEIPAPQDGSIAELLVKIGDKVSEGSAILRLTSTAGAQLAAQPEAISAPAAATSSDTCRRRPAGRFHLAPRCLLPSISAACMRARRCAVSRANSTST